MREIKKLEKNWRFCLTSLGTKEKPSSQDNNWEKVTVPHDWAIYKEFSPENDPQPLENSVLDYHEGMIQIGRTGGLPIMGTGWYESELFLPEGYGYYALEFDGIMNHAEVYVNGHLAGSRPYGYSSFCVDITSFIQQNANNHVVVKVNSMDKTSRWYPGAGIFRPVRLVMCEKDHVSYNGVWVCPDYDLNSNTAWIDICCDLCGSGQLVHSIYSPDGHLLMSCEGTRAKIHLQQVRSWDVEAPELYAMRTEVWKNGRITDTVFTRFGIRKTAFHQETGFSLNGRQLKIQGVCMHHDAGMLGAAYNREVVRRRLRTLKEMGCNAIRTTHNPPCPETLDLCDEMGILVMEEAFDVWHTPKALNDYAHEFTEWAERDLADMIRRDRNHPCIFIYSIGNEIPDQIYAKGRDTCRQLTSICHREDPSRPVTCGFNRPKAAVENGLTEEVDVVGLNYSPGEYERYHREHPNWIMIATETCSSVSSRGEYHLPAEIEVPPVKHENLQVNSFDYSAVACAYIPDVEFEAQRNASFVAGQFVWTGYDYLGEPTPYREEWPSRSSYFGIFDLAGLKKDRYYAYAANWSKQPMVHLFPHWNWTKDQLVDVHCYTNLPKVCLYLNGKEIGNQERMGHRIVFRQIPFAAGELRAVGYQAINGMEQAVCEDRIHTSGRPYAVKLYCDEGTLPGNGKALAFVEAHIVDEHGFLCPHADECIYFSVEGQGTYVASDSGDSTSTRRFNEPYCEAFHGKLVCVVRAGETAGNIVVRAWGDGLKTDELILQVTEA